MTVLIKAYGPASMPEMPIQGEYVMTYDPEAFDGQGDARFTLDPAKAMRFATMADAVMFVMQRPKTRPNRASDGQPNRPILAFHLNFETVP